MFTRIRCSNSTLSCVRADEETDSNIDTDTVNDLTTKKHSISVVAQSEQPDLIDLSIKNPSELQHPDITSQSTYTGNETSTSQSSHRTLEMIQFQVYVVNMNYDLNFNHENSNGMIYDDHPYNDLDDTVSQTHSMEIDEL